MDKNAIKKYAVWARQELLSRVCAKALQYGISEKGCGDPSAEIVGDRLLTDTERRQRSALIKKIGENDYQAVMEEIAYTWFNRFAALRFMEVNGYLPTHVRLFTDEKNAFKPQIITEAIHLDLDGLDMEKVYALKETDQTDELYKYLLITQCNALCAMLPGMFQRIGDETELLFPDHLLRVGSVIERMIADIPEDDWKDAVQIIGWLYQYYNSEKKDDVFVALKKNIKITKENIPAATQLFTPDWIVRYMVENSLGRLWLEGHPNEELKSHWKYYLEEAEQEPDVQTKLTELRKEYAAIKPEEIKCVDPCMGSGHILAYLFDVLIQIYESYGYSSREAVESIVKNNLYGLDIDDRAAQLANFVVMMKARQYDRGFFRRDIQPNVYAVAESNQTDDFLIDYFANGDAKLNKAIKTVVDELRDAKEYGSLLTITPQDWNRLYARFDEIRKDSRLLRDTTLNELLPLVQTAQVLAQKYDVVVTNPPYMGASNMNTKLGDYVKKNYPDSKSDLFATFMEKCGAMTVQNRYQAMITQHAWMFLSSYEKLRLTFLLNDTVNMVHLGTRAFEEIGGEVVQTTSFVFRKSRTKNAKGVYCRLVEPSSQQGKEEMFLAGENRFESEQDNFSKIPGSPIAYWVSVKLFEVFEKGTKLGDIADTKQGLATADNNRFLREWFEVDNRRIKFDATNRENARKSQKKWFPYNKGGDFRKWYGNNDFVVNWENDGFEIRNFYDEKGKLRSVSRNTGFYFRESTSWSKISIGSIAFRYYPQGFIFDVAGCSIFYKDNERMYNDFGFINSKVSQNILSVISPTLNYEVGQIASLPVIYTSNCSSQIANIVKQNIKLSIKDWDSFEISWNFLRHPLIGNFTTVSEAYANWASECNERFNSLKANEEELNRIFIDIYGLQEELTPEVEEKDVTVRKADLQREVKSFISYAVGCMFGRYSLDEAGLAYAGGDWDATKDRSFPADDDNIIPICDDEYFLDDIVRRFVKFIETVYGQDTLAENLKFIADALGGKGQPEEVIRRYFQNDFYADHLKIYQKRPIYWLFDSGKKNGFKALIYMHRYQPDTIARLRTDYVHEQQARYRTVMTDLERRIETAAGAERVKLSKRLAVLRSQSDEILAYEEKIHHLADQMISIDLDDGVKHNYALFENVLAKIK